MSKKQLKYENPRKFSCRLDSDLWQDLHNRAEQDGITMTALINFILKVYTSRTTSEPKAKAVYGAEIHERSEK